jgi:hypothetical protein
VAEDAGAVPDRAYGERWALADHHRVALVAKALLLHQVGDGEDELVLISSRMRLEDADEVFSVMATDDACHAIELRTVPGSRLHPDEARSVSRLEGGAVVPEAHRLALERGR